jgi:hypothetical protein
LKTIVEEYTNSMAYDGYHLGLDERAVAVNVSDINLSILGKVL